MKNYIIFLFLAINSVAYCQTKTDSVPFWEKSWNECKGSGPIKSGLLTEYHQCYFDSTGKVSFKSSTFISKGEITTYYYKLSYKFGLTAYLAILYSKDGQIIIRNDEKGTQWTNRTKEYWDERDKQIEALYNDLVKDMNKDIRTTYYDYNYRIIGYSNSY